MSVQIKKKDGTTCDGSKDKVIPISNAAHSFFSDVKLSINYNCVEGGNGMYHWLAYMNNLINFNQAAKGTHMLSQGFHIATEHPDGKSFEDDEANTTNAALIKTYANSQWVYFSMPLKLDVFQQGKSCPPGFRLEVTLVRNSPTSVSNIGREELLNTNSTYEM